MGLFGEGGAGTEVGVVVVDGRLLEGAVVELDGHVEGPKAGWAGIESGSGVDSEGDIEAGGDIVSVTGIGVKGRIELDTEIDSTAHLTLSLYC